MGRRYPLILDIYGLTPDSENVNAFGLNESGPGIENRQFYATRGFAVLRPDLEVHSGAPMRDVQAGVERAANAAIESGVADPDRLGIMGWSYGGYSVLSVLVASSRFKAAVSGAGFSDWITEYGQLSRDGTNFGISQAESSYGLGGSPWQRQSMYIRNSPLFYFNRLSTPILLIQGSSDSAVDHYNAALSFVSLRRLGKKVEYAEYNNSGHSPEDWRTADQADLLLRVTSWFERYMCPRKISAVGCGE